MAVRRKRGARTSSTCFQRCLGCSSLVFMTGVLEWDLRNRQLGKEKAKAKHREHRGRNTESNREEESEQSTVKREKQIPSFACPACGRQAAAGRLRVNRTLPLQGQGGATKMGTVSKVPGG